MHSTVQNLDKNICLPPPINQSSPASVSTVLPQSGSDLYKDWGKIIDGMLTQVAQTVNQMLLKTTTGSPTSNLDLNDTHMTILQTDNQPP